MKRPKNILDKLLEEACYNQAENIRRQIQSLFSTVCEYYTKDNTIETYLGNQLIIALELFKCIRNNLLYILREDKFFDQIEVLDPRLKGIKV